MNRMSCTKRVKTIALALSFVLIGMIQPAYSDDFEIARTMGQRLTGFTLDAATLQTMAGQIGAGNRLGAAQTAITSPLGQRGYYNTILNGHFTLDTTVERNPFEPLNDYVTTMIGLIRDDFPFISIFSHGNLYVGDDTLTNVQTYDYGNNNNPSSLEEEMFRGNLDLVDSLSIINQSDVNQFQDQGNVAGVATSRAIGSGFMFMGTNRSLFGHYFYPHMLCEELDDIRDNSLSQARIARDVLRNPAGKPSIFVNECSSCHTHLDGNRGSAANYDFNGRLRDNNTNYLSTQNGAFNHKYNRNELNFPAGYVTTDTSFINFLPNSTTHAARLGFRGATSGTGLRQFGEMITRSVGFSKCMVRRAHKAICGRKPLPEEEGLVTGLANQFEADNYNFKNLTLKVSTLDTCLLLTN